MRVKAELYSQGGAEKGLILRVMEANGVFDKVAEVVTSSGLVKARPAETFHMSLGALDAKYLSEVIVEIVNCKWKLVVAKREMSNGPYVEDRESIDL